MYTKPARFALLLLAALATGACGDLPILVDPERSAAIGEPGMTSAPSESEITARREIELRRRSDGTVAQSVDRAAAAPDRLAGDVELDATRKGPDVLKFLGIRPGMTVLDLYSGGGYYAELTALVVGVSGKVVAHNNPPYLDFAGQELAARFTPGRLVQVDRLTAADNALELPAGRFNAVLLIDVYPDIYFAGDDGAGPRIEGRQLFAEIYRSLRPGGVLGIADHATLPGAPAAVTGAGASTGADRLRAELTAAGFRYEARSEVLLGSPVAEPVPRFRSEARAGKGQVLLRFRKPRA
jgi:predicted methyltransferase